MEFLAGILCLGIGVAAISMGITRKGWWLKGTIACVVLLELLVLATTTLDFGYSWVEDTAISIALERNIWLLIPQASALLILLSLLLYGRGAAPISLLISVFEALSVVPIMYLVGEDQDMSFLAPAPLLALYASVTVSFFLVPLACTVVPSPSSRWFRITMEPRRSLIDAVASLTSLGLLVRPPQTIFESGSAEGRVKDTKISLDTTPVLKRLAYGLTITAHSDADLPLPKLPGFAPCEDIRRVPSRIEYRGISSKRFDISPTRLRNFIETLAGI